MITLAVIAVILGVVVFIIALAVDVPAVGIGSLMLIVLGTIGLVVFSDMDQVECEDVTEILVETNGEQYCRPRTEVATWEPAT